MRLFRRKKFVWQTASPLQKKKHFISDAAYYSCIAALLGAMVMYFVYLLQQQTVAGGDQTVLRMDLYHQYGPLYAELYDRLKAGESLLYSWNTGFGSGFLGNLLNYCSSPFTLLILFFKHENIPDAIALLILLKASASAASFTYFLNRSLGSRKTSIAFGLLYAFSGYFVAYSWNLMWLDAFLIFPLVILGIEKIVKHGKSSLYIAALTYTMITNYYMAYMVCILSILYFLFFYFSRYRLNDKLQRTADEVQPGAVVVDGGVLESVRNSRFMAAGIRFALGSVLAFLLAAFTLLPVFFVLKTSSATSSTGLPSYTEWKEYFSIFDFLANHLANLEPTIRSSGTDILPNIYCGVMTILLVPAFLFNKKISRRRKIAAVLLLVAFYGGFCLNFFNFIWHGLHYPNDLPYRYSFGYSFLLLLLAYEAFLRVRDLSWKFYLGTGIGLMGFIVLVQELGSKNIGKYTLMINLLFVAAYVLTLCLLSSRKLRRDTITVLLVCTVIGELVLANTANYVMSQNKQSYVGDYADFRLANANVDAYEEQYGDKELFYREERSRLLTRMDPSWLDYNGVSVFSSMAYESLSKLQRQLGLFSNGINSFTYNPQTAVYNSMFNIKYLYDKEDLLDTDYMYTLIPDVIDKTSADGSENIFDEYEYNWYLPLGFCVDDNMENWADSGDTNPFVNQNNYFKYATGIADVLEMIPPDEDVTTTNGLYVNDLSIKSGSYSFNAGTEESTATVTVTAPKTGQVCIYFKSPSCLGYNVTADNGFKCSTRYSSGSMTYYSVNVGELAQGEQLHLALTYPGDSASGTAYVYTAMLDAQRFEEGYNRLVANGTLRLTKFEETYLEGTVDVANDDTLLYTSIPYDKSWVVRVNGETVADEDIVKIANALLALRMEKGEGQTVSFRYEPQGLRLGLCLSVGGLLLAVALALLGLLRRLQATAAAPAPLFFYAPDTQPDELIPDLDEDYADEPTGREAVYKQKTSFLHIIACYLTLGVYWFFWKYSIYKDVKRFADTYGDWKETSPIPMLFVPFYGAYWLKTRSERIAKTASLYGISIQPAGTWRMLLDIFLCGFFAYAELQDDLNFVFGCIDPANKRAEKEPEPQNMSVAADGFEDISDGISDNNADKTSDDTAEGIALPVEADKPEEAVCEAIEATEPEEPAPLFTKHTAKSAHITSVILALCGILVYALLLSWLVALATEEQAEETTLITLPPETSSTAAPSETESESETTTETTTEAPTEPESTVLDNSLLAEAARSLLNFTGIELGDDSMILFVGVNTREGDTLLTVCERYGVSYEMFSDVLLTLNTLTSAEAVLDTGTQLILPMRIAETTPEPTETQGDDETVG